MNPEDFIERLYEATEKYPHDYCADEVLEAYIEICKENEEEPTLELEDFQEAIETLIFDYENTCERCGGRGCNWCLMVGY